MHLDAEACTTAHISPHSIDQEPTLGNSTAMKSCHAPWLTELQVDGAKDGALISKPNNAASNVWQSCQKG